MALGIPDIVEGLKSLGKTFNPIVKESSKIAANSSKGMQKVASDIKTPLQDMSSFFASIDGGIRKVAQSVGETTGISKVMARIMADDLKLTKKQQAKKDRVDAIAKSKKDKELAAKGPSFGEDLIETLKESFKDLVPKKDLGDLTKILLIATGAAILIKFAGKFQKVLAPVLKFLFETLIPGFKELFATIMKSPTGFLGIGGVATLATTAVSRYGASVRGFFTGIINGLKTLRLDMGKEFTKFLGKGKIISGFRKVLAPIGRIGTFIGNLTKAIGDGAKAISKFIPFVKSFATIGKNFIRFLGPVGLVVQAFVGLFSGITRAISTFKAGGSIFAVIGSFFSGIFDALIGSVVNLLADLLGFIVKKLGFEKLGEFISNLDFTTEGISNGIKFVIDKIKGFFIGIQDGFYTFINGAIKLYNKIPFVEDIPLLETKAMREGEKGSEGTNMAETMALKNRAATEGDAKRLAQTTGTTVTAIGDTTTEKFDFKAEKAKVLKAEQEKLATQKSQAKSMQIINAANNSKGATTVNQTSVHSNGEPASDHNDMTAKHLTAAFAV